MTHRGPFQPRTFGDSVAWEVFTSAPSPSSLPTDPTSLGQRYCTSPRAARGFKSMRPEEHESDSQLCIGSNCGIKHRQKNLKGHLTLYTHL